MQFVLRDINDQNNPTLARVYGPEQSTRGRVVLFDREGDRTKFILVLAQGGRYGCDGINEYHYNGTKLDETDSNGLIWKFHSGTRSLGFSDPVQGRPELFPNLDFTFSQKCYLEVRLPASQSPGADQVPDGSEVFLRGLKVMHYAIVDGLLQETTPACTANNAWVGLDIWREVKGLPLSRFQRWAQQWIDYRDRCDELIPWDKGVDYGGEVLIPRYEANCVFPNSLSPIAAFQTVIDRSPGVAWNDVDGGICVLVNPDRDSVHTLNSFNILKKGVTLTPPDPDSLYNYYLGLFRDLDDINPQNGQRLFRQRKVEADFPALRDASGGKLRKFGPVDFGGGPMHQSLAERMLWTVARRLTAVNAERDMSVDPIYPVQFEVKGLMDSFHVAKGDYVEIADHYMVGLATPLCAVGKEVTHARKGERTFSVQLTSRDSYRDTDHSTISGLPFTEDDDMLIKSLVVPTDADTDVYTVPPGKKLVPTRAILRNPTDSLGTIADDASVGPMIFPAAKLIDLIATNKFLTAYPFGDEGSVIAAGATVQIVFNDHSISESVTVDLFGYLVNA